LLRAGYRVLDLGCRPGSWLQYALSVVGPHGAVVGIDRDALPKPIAGVRVLQGDIFTTPDAELLGPLAAFDVVLSDMAPNISGIEVSDQARMMHLVELAAEFASKCLKPGGSLLVKLFQGRGFDEYVRDLRAGFARVTLRKPKASRARSREVYALATGWKGEK